MAQIFDAPSKAILRSQIAEHIAETDKNDRRELQAGEEPLPNDRTSKGRVEITERPARERRLDFDGVENGMSREEVVQECGRCLRCDRFGCGVMEGGRHQYA